MQKNIQNQLDVEDMFSFLKQTFLERNGYSLYSQSCRTAPTRTTSVLWPWYIAYERWEKGYVSHHESVRNLTFQVIMKGDMKISVGRRKMIISPGMAGIVIPGSNQMTSGPSGFCETVSLVFSGTALQAILSCTSFSSLETLSPVPLSFYQLIRELINMRLDPGTNPSDISAASCKLILEASELLQSRHQLPESLALALHYMRSEISKKLTIGKLASNAHCSRQELQRLFRLHFNETPFEHFGKMRFELAAELLQNSELSIKEIALQCGFRSQLYFSTAFRKCFKLSPREFRKQFPGHEMS